MRIMINIVGGTLRGRKLQVPPGDQVRPTVNRVRQAIFNVLHHLLYFEDHVVLDLYAGTGALGIEALSWGANCVYFIEPVASVRRVLQQNLEHLDLVKQGVSLIPATATRWLPQFRNEGSPCLIFVDPPYLQGEYEQILPLIANHVSIPKKSLVVVESPKRLDYPVPSGLELIKSKHYGNVNVHFYEVTGQGRK